MGKDCKRIFISSENRGTIKDSMKIEYVPTYTRHVKACFNVNECGYALCMDCYNNLLLNGSVGENRRNSRRRAV